MNIERDKFIHEMMDKIYHEVLQFDGGWECKTCKFESSEDDYKIVYHRNIEFNEWEGFGKLLSWAQTKHWWEHYCCDLVYCDYKEKYPLYINEHRNDYDGILPVKVLTPNSLADSIYEYLKWMEDNK